MYEPSLRRQHFGGVAEISIPLRNIHIVAPTDELSRVGCLVRTCADVPVGTEVSLKITNDGCEFNVVGEVSSLLPEEGMGIRFAAITPSDDALLEDWLKKTNGMGTDSFSSYREGDSGVDGEGFRIFERSLRALTRPLPFYFY
jgi:hypothetical protein